MNRSGFAPLAVILAVVWLIVWLLTQVAPSPPLSTGPTIIVGLVATEVVLAGYGSMFRRPRRGGFSRAGSLDGAADDTLVEVSRTLPYLRRGLTTGTADRAAEAILPLSGANEVEITDTVQVLGRAGSGDSSGYELQIASRSAIEQTETVTRAPEDSPTTHVAVPMKVDGEVVGTLCANIDRFEPSSVERIECLASLVSVHLELASLKQASRLASDAKLDALRSQINPHFLFNTLNTIASKSRHDPEATRQLLQRLAEFFRYSMKQEGHFADFSHEYYFVRTYVALEQARYDDRLKVHYDIDPQALSAQVPVLTIQPLVENSIKHGLAQKNGGGTVTLRARVDTLAGATRIMVRDDGVGMEPDVLRRVLGGTYKADSGGVGLANISERLQSLFGERYHFDIRSSPKKGTRVDLELPFKVIR